MDVPPNRLRNLVARVRIEVFGIDQLRALRILVKLSAEGADDDARIDDRRSRYPTGFNRLTQRRIGVEAAVAQIALEREPVIEQRVGIAGSFERPVRRRIGDEHFEQRRRVEHPIAELRRAAVERHRFYQRHGQVVVGFDQPGQDRRR